MQYRHGVFLGMLLTSIILRAGLDVGMAEQRGHGDAIAVVARRSRDGAVMDHVRDRCFPGHDCAWWCSHAVASMTELHVRTGTYRYSRFSPPIGHMQCPDCFLFGTFPTPIRGRRRLHVCMPNNLCTVTRSTSVFNTSPPTVRRKLCGERFVTCACKARVTTTCRIADALRVAPWMEPPRVVGTTSRPSAWLPTHTSAAWSRLRMVRPVRVVTASAHAVSAAVTASQTPHPCRSTRNWSRCPGSVA